MVLDQWDALSVGGAVEGTLDPGVELKLLIPAGCTHELDR